MCRETETQTCELLSRLIGSALEAQAFVVVGPLLQQILFGLASTLDTASPDQKGQQPDTSPILQLIISLTLKVAGLSQCLKSSLDAHPLPRITMLVMLTLKDRPKSLL